MTRTVRRRNCCGFWVDRLTMPDCMPSSLDKPILQKSVFATKCRETSFQHLVQRLYHLRAHFLMVMNSTIGLVCSKGGQPQNAPQTLTPSMLEFPAALAHLSKQVSTGTSRPNETMASRPISCSWSQRFLIFIIEWDLRIAKPSWW